MPSDCRQIPTSAEAVCLEVSLLMAPHGFLGSVGCRGTESLWMLGQGGFRQLEMNYAEGPAWSVYSQPG